MQGITLSVYRFQNTIADTILEEGHAMQQRGLVRMQWDLELSSEVMPAAYRPLMHDDAVFDWPERHIVHGGAATNNRNRVVIPRLRMT